MLCAGHPRTAPTARSSTKLAPSSKASSGLSKNYPSHPVSRWPLDCLKRTESSKRGPKISLEKGHRSKTGPREAEAFRTAIRAHQRKVTGSSGLSAVGPRRDGKSQASYRIGKKASAMHCATGMRASDEGLYSLALDRDERKKRSNPVSGARLKGAPGDVRLWAGMVAPQGATKTYRRAWE